MVLEGIHALVGNSLSIKQSWCIKKKAALPLRLAASVYQYPSKPCAWTIT